MSDVKQAAERLRRWKEDCFACNMAQVQADRTTLADAWLEEHLADDDEAITEEWLTATFGSPVNCWASWRCGQFYIGNCFGWHLTRERPLVNVNHITTRGQLRKLLAALGANQ